MKNNKQPAIRFAGFTDDWEQRKFDKIFNLSVPNNTLSRANLNYEDGKFLNIHYGDILVKFNSILDVKKENLPFITEDGGKDFTRFLLKNGDIIFADTAEDETTGKAVELSNVSDEQIISGLHTIVARPNKAFGNMYLGYYLNSETYHRQVIKLLQGIKVLSISKSNIVKTEVSFPKYMEEQKKSVRSSNSSTTLSRFISKSLLSCSKQNKDFYKKCFPRKEKVFLRFVFRDLLTLGNSVSWGSWQILLEEELPVHLIQIIGMVILIGTLLLKLVIKYT